MIRDPLAVGVGRGEGRTALRFLQRQPVDDGVAGVLDHRSTGPPFLDQLLQHAVDVSRCSLRRDARGDDPLFVVHMEAVLDLSVLVQIYLFDSVSGSVVAEETDASVAIPISRCH